MDFPFHIVHRGFLSVFLMQALESKLPNETSNTIHPPFFLTCTATEQKLVTIRSVKLLMKLSALCSTTCTANFESRTKAVSVSLFTQLSRCNRWSNMHTVARSKSPDDLQHILAHLQNADVYSQESPVIIFISPARPPTFKLAAKRSLNF